MIIGMTTTPNIYSQVWINSLEEGSDNAEVEMADGIVVAELTDADGDGEVAVHFTFGGETQALVSIYMTRVAALALASELMMEATRSVVDFGVVPADA